MRCSNLIYLFKVGFERFYKWLFPLSINEINEEIARMNETGEMF